MVQVQPLAMQADHSYNQYGTEEPLFEYGDVTYSARYLDKALLAAGTTRRSLLRSDWQSRLTRGPYIMGGTLSAYGAAVACYYPFANHVGVGIHTGAMKLMSAFHLARNIEGFEGAIFGPGDEYDLQVLQQQLHDALSINGYSSNRFTMFDTELYLHFFVVHDYQYLCRLVDAGLSLGVVAPTGKKRSPFDPASVPAGGDGRWGCYVEGNLDAILKQDLHAGLLVRVQKRLPNTSLQRMPVGDEPTMFGAIVGPARVNPGLTYIVSPYAMFEHLRDGFGLYLGYSITKHHQDYWTDERCDQSVPVKLNVLQEQSVWAAERVLVGIFYDLDLGSREYRFNPIISANLEIPVAWVMAERSAITYGLSLGVEMHF
ncbi:MAG: hypothetical protein M1549_01710 [Candidatus Dependentiae bacterium]|nr:hypothetical protein [Candidatus Dependentiae bacterium]